MELCFLYLHNGPLFGRLCNPITFAKHDRAQQWENIQVISLLRSSWSIFICDEMEFVGNK